MMRYYFLLILLALAGLGALIYKQKDDRREQIKISRFTVNQLSPIGDVLNKNFGNHRWLTRSIPGGESALVFNGVILPQDSLRLTGAEINLLFLVKPDSNLLKNDSAWWSYPAGYIEKKREALGCFETEKLIRTLTLIYARPENLVVNNSQQWFSCGSAAVKNRFSVELLQAITADLLHNCPLSLTQSPEWQTVASTGLFSDLGWNGTDFNFAFHPEIQQEIKNLLRYNANQNARLAYLQETHPLEKQDSLKIFF